MANGYKAGHWKTGGGAVFCSNLGTTVPVWSNSFVRLSVEFKLFFIDYTAGHWQCCHCQAAYKIFGDNKCIDSLVGVFVEIN